MSFPCSNDEGFATPVFRPGRPVNGKWKLRSRLSVAPSHKPAENGFSQFERAEERAAEFRRLEEVDRLNEKLRRANRELEEFAFVASHDLREPLRMINIYTQLLIQECSPAAGSQAREFAQHIEYSVARLEHLIADLLQYSRAGHEGCEYSLVPVPLRNCCDRAIAAMRGRLEAAGAEVEFGPLPTVLADEAQISVVLQNLLSNSLKYAHPERAPRVRIWADANGERWNIHVADNGIGFEPQFGERIFGLFKRLHGREVPGTGLGLAICRRIIERHGGTIHAEGKAQEGAIFTFTLKGSSPNEPGLTDITGRGQSR